MPHLNRYRLACQQGEGGTYVSSLLLGKDEAAAQLAAEAAFHAMAGWHVITTPEGGGIECRKEDVVRKVWAIEFDAMNDPGGGFM